MQRVMGRTKRGKEATGTDSYPVAFRRRKRGNAEDFGKEIGRAKGYGQNEAREGSPSFSLPHNPLRAPKSDRVRVWAFLSTSDFLKTNLFDQNVCLLYPMLFLFTSPLLMYNDWSFSCSFKDIT